VKLTFALGKDKGQFGFRQQDAKTESVFEAAGNDFFFD